MPSLGNVVVVAEQLLGKLGKGAPEILDARAKAHLKEGDLENARFWQRVAKTIRHMLTFDPAYIGAGTGSRPIELPPAVYRQAFASLPDASLLLQPNLVIVGVNRAYVALSRMPEESLVGADLFGMFPDNPDDRHGHGEDRLSQSLLQVLEMGRPDRMALQRYDVRNPAGRFEERWWQTTNAPMLDDSGRVSLILHQTREVKKRKAPGTSSLSSR